MKIDKCLQVIDEKEKYLMRNFQYYPIVIKEAKGSIITDLDNNKFIDFLSSASSLNLGSSNEILTKAIKNQLDKFSQYCIGYIANEQVIEYAKLLTSVYPGGIKAKVSFANSGSEANDTAIKFARAYTKRQKIISFLNGYHGSTYGAISISSCTNKMRNNFGPFLPEVYIFPFYDIDINNEIVERESTKEIEKALENYLPAKEVAAIFIEIVQGDAGILPAHPIFIKKLYNLCKKNGILFIVDDVQHGFFRTGKMFSIEHYDIIPDGITLGKSFGAGLVGSCFLAKAEIIDVIGVPGQVFTLMGNALTSTAGIAAFNIYYSKEFQEILEKNIKLFDNLGKDLKKKQPEFVTKVRNIGMSMGVEINNKNDPNATYKIIFRCYEKGLIMVSIADNVLRIQPPLNIEEELLKKGFNIINEAIEDYKNGKINDEVLKYKQTW